MAAVRVAVLSDDLIWGTRLVEMVRAIGAAPVPCRTAAALADGLPHVDLVLVDLTARTYDAVAAVELAARAGRRPLAVGQHDDAVLRARARAAGAERVLAYRALADGGPAALGAWIEAAAGAETAGAPDRVDDRATGRAAGPSAAASRGPIP